MDSLAITYVNEGDEQRIITPIAVRQSMKVCKIFNCADIQFSARALWDTGSTGCCINQRLADSLKLENLGNRLIFGSRGEHEAPTYMLDVILADGVLLENLLVSGVQSSNSFDFIMGMNIIRLGDFALTNDNGKTVMSFRLPAANVPIDFSKM